MTTSSLDLQPLQAAFARLRGLAASAPPEGELAQAVAVLGDELDRASAAATQVGESEERLRLMVSAVEDYAIFMLDPRGVVLSWNTGAERIKGYAAEEIIGSHFGRFYVAEDVAAGKPLTVLAIAEREGHFVEEGWRLRKDGSRFWASVVVTAIRGPAGELRGFGKVTRDLTERKLAEETLRQRDLDLELERETRGQMEEAVRLRDTFLAVAAHELRTPLTTILGTAEHQQRRLARNQQVPEAEQLRAQTLVTHARRLQRLIDTLLDVNRLQADQFALSPGRFDLAELIREVIAEAQPMLVHHELRLLLPDEPLPLAGDRERLSLVLHNLVQNAAKYSPDGGAIAVELTVGPELALVSVADEGLGIAPADLPHIFERFYRGQRDEGGDPRSVPSGLGIGLYVAGEIVARHGGSIRAESEPGRGSRFTVALPLAPAETESHSQA
ncbi:MAG TPA: PAS domain-containing sensor histidine kinase [Herpetosiphonaceae bacterium]